MSITAQLPDALAGLARHAQAWQRKPLLRELYQEFYDLIDRWRSDAPGRDVELGSGQAEYRRHRPGTLCCDLMPFPWLDFSADACRLPVTDGGVANLTMIDVLHHLAYVRRFFAETTRILAPGGRMILLEPYVSPASWPVYRFLHREPCDGRVRPLDVAPDQ
ncbi:MAG: class I SAM-dependent methyltransferase, partial [bacterium]|nr:class I SAM-dependent methyltransferase [bacterium]